MRSPRRSGSLIARPFRKTARGSGGASLPVGGGHLPAGRGEPREGPERAGPLATVLPVDKAAALEHAMVRAEPDEPADEPQQCPVCPLPGRPSAPGRHARSRGLACGRPIDPGDLVVLAVGVVVARWVRPISSPASSIGTPWDSSSVARKLRFCRSRRTRMSGSSEEPSAPQFQDRLSLLPSRPPSPLAWLCLRSQETRSARVNPSWQVTKLTEATGRLLSCWYRSDEPVSRKANSGSVAGRPRQKSRTVSR